MDSGWDNLQDIAKGDELIDMPVDQSCVGTSAAQSTQS